MQCPPGNGPAHQTLLHPTRTCSDLDDGGDSDAEQQHDFDAELEAAGSSSDEEGEPGGISSEEEEEGGSVVGDEGEESSKEEEEEEEDFDLDEELAEAGSGPGAEEGSD